MQSFYNTAGRWFYIAFLVGVSFSEREGWRIEFIHESNQGRLSLKTEKITREEAMRLTQELEG